MASRSSWSGIRSLAVTIGPSLLLDGVVAVSAWATLTGRAGAAGRGLRLLAALISLTPPLYLLAGRRSVLGWGATPAEMYEDLPGDEVVPEPVWQSTRAIDIAAPVEAVWPWLVQMGQDRAGLYSYDWLENLAGLEFHNVDRIVPEWQHVAVGDPVRFAPNQETLVVCQVEPNRCLVWRVLNPATHQVAEGPPGPVWVDATWAFVLRQAGPQRSRLIQRFRFGVRPRLLGVLYTALMELPHFVMERRMLAGIRERAEGSRQGSVTAR